MFERRKLHTIRIENRVEDQDNYFIEHLLAPYLA